MHKILKVRKFGNSLVVTMPKTICEMYNISKDTKFELSVFGDGIQLKKWYK